MIDFRCSYTEIDICISLLLIKKFKAGSIVSPAEEAGGAKREDPLEAPPNNDAPLEAAPANVCAYEDTNFR